jgi:hypothetical protein
MVKGILEDERDADNDLSLGLTQAALSMMKRGGTIVNNLSIGQTPPTRLRSRHRLLGAQV